MPITTRARVALLFAIVSVVVVGITGTQYVSAGSGERSADGSDPGSGGGGDGAAGVCAAPEPGAAVTDCDDTIENPPIDPGDCGEQVTGTGPDATVSYTPCPGDEDPIVTDPYDGAQRVEPTPGMSDVYPRIFDKVVVRDGGTRVTVYFWSGVEPCYVLDHVDVEYGAGAITITLFEGHDASVGDVACIEIALLKKVVIQLDEPVGDRQIVDGAA